MKQRFILIVFVLVSGGFCLAACPSADLNGDCLVNFVDFQMAISEGSLADLHAIALQWLESDDEPLSILGRVKAGADDPDSFAVEYAVVDKQRVGRTVFQYECRVILTNISGTTFDNVRLGIAGFPDNVTLIDPHVNFGDARIDAGESAASVDTCILTVDRSEPIYPVEILWLTVREPDGMVWVDINDPGVPGHEGFNGYMSKYETTNAQYCQFLNAALASGDIYVDSDKVYGSSGSNSGGDFVDEIYCYTHAASTKRYNQILYSGGTFSVISRDSYSMARHPVLQVSWYGATAFCNYYGYRLPTEWEWQAVADYDGSYVYGCGTTISFRKATCYRHNPLNLSVYPFTSPVDYYPSYGYGLNDMAGGVWEWTSSCQRADCDRGLRVVRGGGWDGSCDFCRVDERPAPRPFDTGRNLGFRVCR